MSNRNDDLSNELFNELDEVLKEYDKIDALLEGSERLPYEEQIRVNAFCEEYLAYLTARQKHITTKIRVHGV